MSKGKNITPNQRVMIKVLLEQNLNPVQIAKKLNLSRCAIQNAIKHINKFEMLENASRAPKKRSTTERIDRIIRRLSEDNRRLTARNIHNEIKKPLVSLKNWKARVEFTREHLTWSTADLTKVSKFNRFESDGKKYVRCRPGEECMPKCAILSITHGRDSMRVWAAFNRNEPGPLHIVEGIMDSTSYAKILQDNLLPYVRSQRLGRNWIFQQDNDPK
uniref:HTH_38 domain-containing protein n=1 Tax=Heterorhabditis bacteriophora TaxID=37862 RepID=A0A1I7XBU6_HETBA